MSATAQAAFGKTVSHLDGRGEFLGAVIVEQGEQSPTEGAQEMRVADDRRANPPNTIRLASTIKC